MNVGDRIRAVASNIPCVVPGTEGVIVEKRPESHVYPYAVQFEGGVRDYAVGADEIGLVTSTDPVNHPNHYTNHPSGIECIQITEHMSFNLGNALKYIWRCDLKNDAIEDLKKAQFYIEREIKKREATIL